MKFLCMIYMDAQRLRQMPKAELEACMAEQLDYFEKLKVQGHGDAAFSLQPADAAACVAVRGGQLLVTDGPFAETSEQFGGFFLIDARDLNEAIRLAGQIPLARDASIEVRPLR